MDRFEVHTNFTSTAKEIHRFDLAGLADPANLDILRKVFTEPEALRPGITSEKITVEAARAVRRAGRRHARRRESSRCGPPISS